MHGSIRYTVLDLEFHELIPIKICVLLNIVANYRDVFITGMLSLNTSNFELPPAPVPDKRQALCNNNTVVDVEPVPCDNDVNDDDSARQPLMPPPPAPVGGDGGGEASMSSRTTDTLLSPLLDSCTKPPPNVRLPPNSVYFTRPLKQVRTVLIDTIG